jgi:hypothetical protein
MTLDIKHFKFLKEICIFGEDTIHTVKLPLMRAASKRMAKDESSRSSKKARSGDDGMVLRSGRSKSVVPEKVKNDVTLPPEQW